MYVEFRNHFVTCTTNFNEQYLILNEGKLRYYKILKIYWWTLVISFKRNKIELSKYSWFISSVNLGFTKQKMNVIGALFYFDQIHFTQEMKWSEYYLKEKVSLLTKVTLRLTFEIARIPILNQTVLLYFVSLMLWSIYQWVEKRFIECRLLIASLEM